MTGYSNLTKSLCINLYSFYYAEDEAERLRYLEGFNEKYSSGRLTALLSHAAEMIDAKVLNISKHDYNPYGASAAALVSEKSMTLAHLDKSHLAVHTYHDFFPGNSAASFRVDIDITTCGGITPLCTLDYIIGLFNPLIITLDYKIRGFTRQTDGKKIYIDHNISSIQEYICVETLNKYIVKDINIHEAKIFYTKLIRKVIDKSLFREITEIDNELP
jgi:S-adenosylmethionine decarboxylase